MKKVYFIDKNFINIRLDKWFKNNICYVPQSLLEKNIRTGKIKVNFKKRKSSYKLQLNDQVIVNNFNPASKTKINFKTNQKLQMSPLWAPNNYNGEYIGSQHTKYSDYQKQATDSSESQFDMLKRLELDIVSHQKLISYCAVHCC